MEHSSAISPCIDSHAADLGFVELSALQMVVLGIVQGVTELLPISSTAHLRVLPGLLGWRDPGSAFSAAMQLASTAKMKKAQSASATAFKLTPRASSVS